jgi:hypothetical protein
LAGGILEAPPDRGSEVLSILLCLSAPTLLRAGVSIACGFEVGGSSPLTPTNVEEKPFGENVEGLSHCGDESYAVEGFLARCPKGAQGA